MKTYKLGRGWIIFCYIVFIPLIALLCWLMLGPLYDKNPENMETYWYVILPVSIGGITLLVLGLIDAKKGTFIIGDHKLTATGVFGTREMLFNDVKGYRVTDKFIFIESTKPRGKQLKVSKYFKDVYEIENWLAERYDDLDKKQAEQELEEILNNDEHGWTPEDREKNLKKAKTQSRIINAIGIIVGIWGFFKPEPYGYLVTVAAITPLVAIVAVRVSKGLIRIDERKDSPYPSVTWAILIPSLMLMLRAVLDFELLAYSKVWLYMIMIVASVAALLFVRSKEYPFKNANDFLMACMVMLFVAAYAFGALITVNGQYDKSEPVTYPVKVLDMRVSSGKSTTYYLKLPPWGPRTEEEEVSVSSDVYASTSKGDEVTVYQFQGFFGIPWFYVAH